MGNNTSSFPPPSYDGATGMTRITVEGSPAVNACDDGSATDVPEAFESSNASSGNSSSNSEDEDDDQHHQQQSSNHQDDEEEECPINPYQDGDLHPISSPTSGSDARGALGTPKAKTGSSSECYRLQIFQRKSSPLTVLHSTAGDCDDYDDEDDMFEANTCFPRTNSNTGPLTSSQRSSTPSSNNVVSTANVGALSFQYCREAVTETLTLNDGDCSFPGEGYSSTGSSILGCVSSPLLPKSNSWANLVGLEDVRELNYTDEEIQMIDGDLPTPESDLTGPREYWIVTTAALPWMTGTAVNPLLRAAYLSQRNRRLLLEGQGDDDKNAASTTRSTVTLVLPWLEVAGDRLALYGKDWEDATPQIQEEYIRTWLADSAQLGEEASLETGGITIQWYPARYHQALSSIFAMGDLCELIPAETSNMICILEEPEHVNCYRAPGRESWRDKFPHVIGIVHTNYKAYAQNHYSGLLTGPLVGALSSLMVRAYCDKVVKLSPVLQSYAPYKEVISNVHGIRQEFFQVPRNPSASRIYFIGKLLWAKGLDKLLELEASYRKATGSYFPIDIYGSGPHEGEIQKSFLGHEYFVPPPFLMNNNKKQLSSLSSSSSLAEPSSSETNRHNNNGESSDSASNAAKRYWRRFRQPIPARFLGRMDHAKVGATGEYKIFVNPSITEVLCTTTAEAVAMGFWVILPKHSSNEFFLPFGNCLQYTNRKEFVELLQYCQTHDPPGWCSGNSDDPLEMYGALSWQAATQRLIDTAFLSKRDARRCERLQPKDRAICEWHYALGRGTRGDVLRKVLGGGPVAEQSQYTGISNNTSTSSPAPQTPTTRSENNNASPMTTRILASVEAEALDEMFPATDGDERSFEQQEVATASSWVPTLKAAS